MASHPSSKIPGAKRGRPTFTDNTNRRTKMMTICLTPTIHKQLLQLAYNHNQKPAAMARILVEAGMCTETSGG